MHQSLIELELFKQCSSMIGFPTYSFNSFHLIKVLFVCCWKERRHEEFCSKLQYTKFSYSFKVSINQIFIELLLIKASFLAFRLTPPTVFNSTSYDY